MTWGLTDVADNSRNAFKPQKMVSFGSKNAKAGVVALSMNRTKISFDQDE